MDVCRNRSRDVPDQARLTMLSNSFEQLLVVNLFKISGHGHFTVSNRRCEALRLVKLCLGFALSIATCMTVGVIAIGVSLARHGASQESVRTQWQTSRVPH